MASRLLTVLGAASAHQQQLVTTAVTAALPALAQLSVSLPASLCWERAFSSLGASSSSRDGMKATCQRFAAAPRAPLPIAALGASLGERVAWANTRNTSAALHTSAAAAQASTQAPSKGPSSHPHAAAAAAAPSPPSPVVPPSSSPASPTSSSASVSLSSPADPFSAKMQSKAEADLLAILQQQSRLAPPQQEEGEGEESDDEVSVVNEETGESYGPRGKEPTRFGDWEIKGRCSDF